MPSLSFPDVNVWLAVLLADHIHRPAAKEWWISNPFDVIDATLRKLNPRPGFGRMRGCSPWRIRLTVASPHLIVRLLQDRNGAHFSNPPVSWASL
jgi:hypothetical protein